MNTQVIGHVSGEPACRRGSVRRRSGGVAIHLRGLPGTLGGPPVPVWPCSGWGLPSRPGHPGRWCALTAPFHPCLCPKAIGGLLSVALSCGSPRLAASQHPALRSPDLPRHGRRHAAATRPAHRHLHSRAPGVQAARAMMARCDDRPGHCRPARPGPGARAGSAPCPPHLARRRRRPGRGGGGRPRCPVPDAGPRAGARACGSRLSDGVGPAGPAGHEGPGRPSSCPVRPRPDRRRRRPAGQHRRLRSLQGEAPRRPGPGLLRGKAPPGRSGGVGLPGPAHPAPARTPLARGVAPGDGPPRVARGVAPHS